MKFKYTELNLTREETSVQGVNCVFKIKNDAQHAAETVAKTQ
jgi:hypothetical protein